MTPRDRFLTAVSGGIPDRVPCAPDISNYIPVGRTGLPFWDVYFHGKAHLWRAYIDAAEDLGIDMWIASCVNAPVVYADSPVTISESFDAIDGSGDPRADAEVRLTTYATPDGTLEDESICFRFDPPTHRTRLMKDLKRDWAAYRWLIRQPVALDLEMVDDIRDACHRRDQAFGLNVSYPGFQSWEGQVEGSINTLALAEIDYPAILEEWHEMDLQAGTRTVELLLDAHPDYILLGGSGTLTLASPELARKYAIPAIARWSAMAAERGVPTMLHSCGRSRALVEMLVNETDVSCINPLEVPPMGDVDLREVARTYGDRIALMGNLHTTDVMLRGTPDDVTRAARDAIRDAAAGGGFVLSTGDQCAPGTPRENLLALVAAAREFGTY